MQAFCSQKWFLFQDEAACISSPYNGAQKAISDMSFSFLKPKPFQSLRYTDWLAGIMF